MADRLDFLDTEALRELAVNLFHGWGYNVFRLESQLRTDDLLVRSKAAALLGTARGAVGAAEADLRRERIASPSRAQPFPNPAALADASALERLGQAIGTLKGRIEAAPAPEADRLTARYRAEASTLASLVAIDETLLGQAELLRRLVANGDHAALLARRAEVQTGIAALGATLERRALLLAGPV